MQSILTGMVSGLRKHFYVGNLEYSSNTEPLHKALLQADFHERIRLEKTDLPDNDGKSRGYGFVTLSWAEAANVNPSDICKLYSGMIDASSRYVYFQQIRNDDNPGASTKEREQAKTVQSAPHPSLFPARISGFRLAYT